MNDLELSCGCGEVKGTIAGKDVKSGNRLICCCDACQEFVRFLNRQDELLDEYGGTDIFQVSPSSIRITKGEEQICCVRLSSKGTHRWYTDCCKTPIANTMGPNMPFVGVIHGFWKDKHRWNELVGPPNARVQTKHAYNLPEDAPAPVGFPRRVTFKLILKIFGWKLRGKGSPNPFFDDQGMPISEPTILRN